MFKSLRWRLAVPYLALIFLSTLGLTVYVSQQMRRASLEALETQLLAQAHLLADETAPLLQDPQDPAGVDRLVERWARLLDARITIIASDGRVLAESHTDPADMDNHLNRPEVRKALTSGQAISMRFSNTLNYELMYAAVVARDPADNRVLSIVRVALPLAEIRTNVNRVRQDVLAVGLSTSLLVGLLAVFISERIGQPLRQLTGVAERMADGDLDARLFPTTGGEVGQLTHAFNHMAQQLQTQMGSLAEERGRLAAVLEHMADGVFITDETGRVQLINAAAARLFDTGQDTAIGRSFAQVVPHHQLIDLWRRCREVGEEQVETIEISHHDLFLQAFATPFRQADVQSYLIILQDLTRIRRLETVRRDFISNISHELRTPLAGLKALVDTLRGGAINDPPAAKRFLKRMDSEVDTLTQMVQELLDLSRVESGQAPLRLGLATVSGIVVPAVDRLRPQATRAGLDLDLDLPGQMPQVLADVDRAQTALTNLIHNAVKFTPPGGRVAVTAQAAEGEVVISVQDTGVGIAPDDLVRIFERFYKADRARSGGGTGLGLAIAKHIIQGHGGRIWAESVEGQGSTFSFTLLTRDPVQDRDSNIKSALTSP